MMALAPTFATMMQYVMLYPFVIRGLYLLRQSVEPFYMNPTCLMDFVRVSSPNHYAIHPLWRFYQAGSNITCESITGMPLEDYFVKVYKSGTTEYNIFFVLVSLHIGISCLLFLRHAFGGHIKSVVSLVASIVLAWNIGSLFHLLSHYQNDLHHLNGNVMHHSSFTVEGDSATLVSTLPPGLIINFVINYIMVWSMSYVMLGYFKLDRWMYMNLQGPVIAFKILLQMKIIHPYIHLHSKSWYGPFVSKYIMDEYQGHVMCHHVSGYCLGDAPTYSWFYDRLMYLHGLVYELGYLKFGNVQHYAANITLDYFLLASVFFFMYVTVALVSPFMTKAEKSEKAEKTVSGTKAKAH